MADTLNERFGTLPTAQITATVAGANYSPPLGVKYIWIQVPAGGQTVAFGPAGSVFATSFQVNPGMTLGPIPVINRDAAPAWLVFLVGATTQIVNILEGKNY
jgi:hypothetical protein